MKAKLIFDLSDYDEKKDFERAIKADKLSLALFDLEQWARQIDRKTDRSSVDIEEVRDKIHELKTEYGLYELDD